MIPGYEGMAVLERIVEEEQENTTELPKSKRRDVVRGQLLPHTRDDHEDADRNEHGTLVKWPQQGRSRTAEPRKQEV